MKRNISIYARLAFVVLVIVGSADVATGQSTHYATLSGTAVATDGTPLPAVSITLTGGIEEKTLLAVTNAAGNYYLQQLVPGDYTLTAQLVGFTTATMDLTLIAGQSATANIQMSPG